MDQSNWAVIRISGPDRVKSLNNMCTQDIKRMIPGQSSETFITNLQGKTIGFCSVHMFQDEILIRSNPESPKKGEENIFFPLFFKFENKKVLIILINS